MANLNKTMIIGRVGSHPKVLETEYGTEYLSFSFVVNNREKLPDGSIDNEPTYVDCEIHDRPGGKQLATLAKGWRKGDQHYVEGHLKTVRYRFGGEVRTKNVLMVHDIEFLTPKHQDGVRHGGSHAGVLED